MYRDIVLLAESAKYNNLCVAGVDINSGEWVRIMSEDNDIHCAIKPEDMICTDGTLPEILDVIRIKFKGANPTFFQPENFVFDSSYQWRKIRTIGMRELLRIHPIDIRQFIFYNTEKKIHTDILKNIPANEKYSLTLVSVTNVTVHVREYPERKDVTMSFDHNGERYKYMSITDIDFKNTYLRRDEGDYTLRRATLVLSLGEIYNKDSHHYKLVTTVIG